MYPYQPQFQRCLFRHAPVRHVRSRTLQHASIRPARFHTPTHSRTLPHAPIHSRTLPHAPATYKSLREVACGRHLPAGGPGRSRQHTNLYKKWPPDAISQQVAQNGFASVHIYTRSGFWRPFPSKWPREVPPTYKSIREVASGGRIPAGGRGRSRQHIICTRSGFRRPFPSRWPREIPPTYTSIFEVAFGCHFPAGGAERSRQRTNLYEKRLPESCALPHAPARSPTLPNAPVRSRTLPYTPARSHTLPHVGVPCRTLRTLRGSRTLLHAPTLSRTLESILARSHTPGHCRTLPYAPARFHIFPRSRRFPRAPARSPRCSRKSSLRFVREEVSRSLASANRC